MLITSLDNKKIKEINKLKNKKYRDKENKFIIETKNIIKEAYKEGLLLELFIKENTNQELDIDIETNYVTEEVMNKIKQIPSSNMIGICKKITPSKELGNKILLLDEIQDPGNLGTIIRSSVGFNIDTIVLSNKCCDLYNEKVIRATEGNMFKINILREDLVKTIEQIKNKNIKVFGTDVTNGIDVRNISLDKYAIVMGSEGNGMSQEIRNLVDDNIYIKTNTKIESLNVGVAASIILYELNK